MSNTISKTKDIEPETGFTPAAPGHTSVAQAAKELREAAEEKITTAVHHAEEKFRDTLGKAKVKSDELRERAGESARHLRETACEQWDETRVKAKEIHVTAEDYIRQNPTKCVLGALGVGFLIGLLVRR
ncbi:MAG: DUF883 family protein [Luteolibacter sp.]|jgi:ElaB/YqjD/DUF883 family membrane-anchored ribosome-binding protein